MDIGTVTLSGLFTAGGVVAAAAVVRQFVEVLKVAFPSLDARMSGARMAFIVSAILYLVAWAAVGERSSEGAFAAILAWLSCASAAVGINATVDHVSGGAQSVGDG